MMGIRRWNEYDGGLGREPVATLLAYAEDLEASADRALIDAKSLLDEAHKAETYAAKARKRARHWRAQAKVLEESR